MRNLILILGDQLSLSSPALTGFDPSQDGVLMIEAAGEATAVWSHKARIALFLSAMRHFAEAVSDAGWPLDYVALDADAPPDFGARLVAALRRHRPQTLKVVEAGEWRMQQLIEDSCKDAGVALHAIDDTHFFCSRQEFARWAKAKRELRMEFFYRDMRKKHRVLMDGSEPASGQWNFDADNRSAYPKKTGPGQIPPPAGFAPDAITREVFELIEQRFPDHPGSLEKFNWPVNRDQALHALKVFIETRLILFGAYQDAMWTDTPTGWHSLLSVALNLHLLDPREVIAAAEEAWRTGKVPLEGAEGFIRQILGWREFIRGVYWLDMPGMKDANHYAHTRDLPAWFWSGNTHMACVRDSLKQTLELGYAHHIQRLMVTGNFSLLAGLSPQQVCDWYLAVYVDAIEWVELPNTAGMALHACGPRFTSKPYVASGAYIQRQSNYCSGCRYEPAKRSGDGACPFTTLYWHFIDRHEAALGGNPRTALMAKNLQKISVDERAAIRRHAIALLENLNAL
jgi:deoxyribodipyrimidine photolyase-related protein